VSDFTFAGKKDASRASRLKVTHQETSRICYGDQEKRRTRGGVWCLWLH